MREDNLSAGARVGVAELNLQTARGAKDQRGVGDVGSDAGAPVDGSPSAVGAATPAVEQAAELATRALIDISIARDVGSAQNIALDALHDLGFIEMRYTDTSTVEDE